MKKITGLVLLMSISFNSFASCIDVYEKKIKDEKIHFDLEGKYNSAQTTYNGAAGISGFYFVGAFIGLGTGLGLTPVGWILLGGAPLVFATPLIYNPVVTAPYKRMIKLVKQSNEFKDNQYQNPGRLLRKTFAHLPEDQNMSIEDFADSIIEGNATGTLCEGVVKYKEFQKKIKEGNLL